MEELPRDLLDDFLQQGCWTDKADDNAKEEALSTELLRRLVERYRDSPDAQAGKRALGLFVLALGIAEWGVRDPSGLRADPHGSNWASDSGAGSGKHLMSYSVGGIGISHADEQEMVSFVTRAANLPDLSVSQRDELLRAIAAERYHDRKVTFDKLRAASVCRPGTPTLGTDLRGEPFKHHNIRGGAQILPAFLQQPAASTA